MENKRRKIIPIEELETAEAGYANGISLQLKALLDKGEHRSLNDKEKQKIIKNAAKYFGKFMEALGIDYKNDPNSIETPFRVSKAIVTDIFAGRYNILDGISSFPSDYTGIILEKNIKILGKCSHHFETVEGYCHIAYIPGENGRVIGLSKLNRIAQFFSARGIIQEDLTLAIQKAVDKVCENNVGTIVIAEATHGCVRCRGVRDTDSSMITSCGSGVFMDHSKTAKQEVFDMLKISFTK
ncbi:MAG TPA: GTP cyclohydrolase I [Nitrososphaeraceae archaeon]|nr:GTP cyclohydrolase I [Nitrososphaeraceae archaeon]